MAPTTPKPPNPFKVVPLKPKASTKAPPPSPKRKRADWEAIERDYRTGKFTLHELKAKHGADPAAISRRAARDGWTKDMRHAVKQATDHALLLENTKQSQILTSERSDLTIDALKDQETAPASLVQTILVAAEMNKQVILGHRTHVHKLTDLTNRAVGILEKQVTEAEKPPIEGKSAVDASGILLAAQRAAMTMSKLQSMERRAYGLDDEDDSASEGLGASAQAKALSPAARAARIAKLMQMAGQDEPDAADGTVG